MGQYYKPVIIDNDNNVVAWAYSHDYKEKRTRADGTSFVCGTGLKLMEHSYLDNSFVCAFERLLIDKPQRVVWAGDYAPAEPGETFTYEYEVYESGRTYYPGDFREKALKTCEEGNLYHLAMDADDYEVRQGKRPNTKVTLAKRPVTTTSHPYIINHDKQLFIDKRNVRGGSYFSECWPIHPLPLMCIDVRSLGDGGGDLHEENASGPSWPDVGSWTRDLISVSKTVPAGFTEYIFDLSEHEPKKQIDGQCPVAVMAAPKQLNG